MHSELTIAQSELHVHSFFKHSFHLIPQTHQVFWRTSSLPHLSCALLALQSCIIKRYCEKRFLSKYMTTIGIDYGVTKWVLLNNLYHSLELFVTRWTVMSDWVTTSNFIPSNAQCDVTENVYIQYPGSHREFFSFEPPLPFPGSRDNIVLRVLASCSCALPENIHTPPTEENGISWSKGAL